MDASHQSLDLFVQAVRDFKKSPHQKQELSMAATFVFKWIRMK